MAESQSDQGAAQPGAAGGLLRRQLVVWGLALLCFAIFLLGEYRGFGRLADLSTLDADDGLRLQEVRDLVAGQGWFDTRQYRYFPPDGTLMHWSRLVDAPLAAAISVLRLVVGATLAERIAITLWPVFLLSIYLALAIGGLARAFGARAAALAVIVAVNLLAFRDLFGAGAIDHHNVQIVLLLASVLSFAVASSRPLLAIISGVAAALSLAVGLESLPFVAGIGVIYALAWVFDPSQSRALVLFAGAFALASFAAFVAQTAPALWLAPACDALSTPWLFLAGGSWAVAFVLTNLGPLSNTVRVRLAASIVGGALLAGAFAALFPPCLDGPYHAVPEAFRAAWLELTGEALSLSEMLAETPIKAAVVFGPTLAATIAAWIGAMRTEGDGRRLLLACASLLTLTLVLCLFQIRAIYVGCALTPIAAGWVLDRILAQATMPAARASRAVALLVAGLLFFELPWISSALFVERLGITTPVASHDPDAMRSCLREVPELQKPPKGVILGPIDLGAHILFLTDQAIVAAGYHRNVEGIVAGLTAFAGTEVDLSAVAVRDQADYVALCLPWIDAYQERYGPFAKALAKGAATVPWLEPVPLEGGALKLWRVRREAIAPAS